jgi:hypothetical protein
MKHKEGQRKTRPPLCVDFVDFERTQNIPTHEAAGTCGAVPKDAFSKSACRAVWTRSIKHAFPKSYQSAKSSRQ